MGGVGDEDECFDFVSDVFAADAESDAEEVECVLCGLSFAGLDSLQVGGGDSGLQGQAVLGDSFGFADGFDGPSDYFSFAHMKRVADMRRNAQVSARRFRKERASPKNPRQHWELGVNYTPHMRGFCGEHARKDFWTCAVFPWDASTPRSYRNQREPRGTK